MSKPPRSPNGSGAMAKAMADALSTASLVPLPRQPAAVPWPTEDWPVGPAPAEIADDLDRLVRAMFDDDSRFGTTYATLVVHRGVLIAERYANALPHFDAPPEPIEASTPLLSWSMAKSMLHAAVGPLVAAGRLRLDVPPPVPEWAGAGDPRGAITLEHLLSMRDGLDFVEDYVDAERSDVIEMLFGAGQADVGHFAADRPLAHEPAAVFNYSSGTSNIVSRIVADTVGPGDAYATYLRTSLFEPIGMRSATPRFDDAGTFIGSSFVYATARDFARFGLLALRGGVWNGESVLPDGWIDHGRRARSRDATDGRVHGAHWWVVGDDLGTFWASGYEGQSICCCPALDLLVVRMGKSTEAQANAVFEWRNTMTAAFRAVPSAHGPS
jgi:CubicO group peptidase (beta-lactamase class C family)